MSLVVSPMFNYNNKCYGYFSQLLKSSDFLSTFKKSSSLRCFSNAIVKEYEKEGLLIKDSYIELNNEELCDSTEAKIIANNNLTNHLAVKFIDIMKSYGYFPNKDVSTYVDYYTYPARIGICITIALFVKVGDLKRIFAKIKFGNLDVCNRSLILLYEPNILLKYFCNIIHSYAKVIGNNNAILELEKISANRIKELKYEDLVKLNAFDAILGVIDSEEFCRYVESIIADSDISVYHWGLRSKKLIYRHRNIFDCEFLNNIITDGNYHNDDYCDIHNYGSIGLFTKKLCADADRFIEMNMRSIVREITSNEVSIPLCLSPFNFYTDFKDTSGERLTISRRERLSESEVSTIPFISPAITMVENLEDLFDLTISPNGHGDYFFTSRYSLTEDALKAYRLYYYEMESVLLATPFDSLDIIVYLFDQSKRDGRYSIDGRFFINDFDDGRTTLKFSNDYTMGGGVIRNHYKDDIFINISLLLSPIVYFNNKYKEKLTARIMHRTDIEVRDSYDLENSNPVCMVAFDRIIVEYNDENLEFFYIDPFSPDESGFDTLYTLSYDKPDEDPLIENPAITLSSLLKDLADQYSTTARPKRYFDVKKRGALTKKEQSYVKKRFKELVDREECLKNDKDDPRCYEKVSTDLSPKMKKRKSSYLKDYYEIYRPNEISTSSFIDKNKRKFEKEQSFCPSAPKGLIRIAVETGLPIEALKQVYDIGIGAYASSGSRTGMSAEQWGYGRVYSFIMCYYHNEDGRYSSKRYLKNKTDFSIYEDIEDGAY